ncbi:MAG: hypothetical protein WCJ09_18315 [Planctomycetota bacterium]
MREFFYGWRRKVGCVTLIIAFFFAGAWIRSRNKFDVVNCPLGKEYAIAITSWKEAFAIRIGWDEDSWSVFDWHASDADYFQYTESTSEFYRFKQPIPDGSGCFVSWYLQRDWGGIGVTPLDQRSWRRMIFLIAPYWPIAIALTAISAFLLLSNLGKSIPRKLTEPIAAEVA